MMLYSFFYVPTLSVTNAIAFANLKDAQKEFGIRARWRYAGLDRRSLAVPAAADQQSIHGRGDRSARDRCLLPHPAQYAAGQERAGSAFAPFEAFKLLSVPTILVLFIVTFIDSLVHNCYFITSGPFYEKIGLPENWISTAMSIGQIAEIATMAALGFFLKSLGWRTTMIIGVLGHVVRFAIYALGGYLRRSALAGAYRPQQCRAWLCLRVFLRDGLHFRG